MIIMIIISELRSEKEIAMEKELDPTKLLYPRAHVNIVLTWLISVTYRL